MAWLAIDDDGQEVLFTTCPTFNHKEGAWIADDYRVVELPKGSIKRLLDIDLANDEYRIRRF